MAISMLQMDFSGIILEIKIYWLKYIAEVCAFNLFPFYIVIPRVSTSQAKLKFGANNQLSTYIHYSTKLKSRNLESTT